MRGFLIGLGFFIGWWLLMMVAFGVIGLVIGAMMGGLPEGLHILLWFVYIGAVLIEGIGVACEKDAILEFFAAKLRR